MSRTPNQIGVPYGFRRCSVCKEVLPLDEGFSRKAGNRCGRDYTCRRCRSARDRERRARRDGERESCTDGEFHRLVDAAMRRLGVPELEPWGTTLALAPRAYWDEQHEEARAWAREAGVRVDRDGD